MKEEHWKLSIALPNKENQKNIEEFLRSLDLANRSSKTINTYRYFLESFFREQEESFKELTSDTILSWFEMHQAHVKPVTLTLRLRTLSLFYAFYVEEKVMKRNPVKRRWFPRTRIQVPKYVDKEDIAKIRLVLEKKSLRDRALVEFMLSSGCRVQEVHRLNCSDVDLRNRTALVKGKGGKFRYVHFTEQCAMVLERYIESVPDTSSVLFVSSTTGTRLSIGRMQVVVKEIGEEAGLVKNLHPHRFRHTFATQLLAKGADLSFIADELGHKSLQTTTIYARLPKREVIAMYRKIHG